MTFTDRQPVPVHYYNLSLTKTWLPRNWTIVCGSVVHTYIVEIRLLSHSWPHYFSWTSRSQCLVTHSKTYEQHALQRYTIDLANDSYRKNFARNDRTLWNLGSNNLHHSPRYSPERSKLIEMGVASHTITRKKYEGVDCIRSSRTKKNVLTATINRIMKTERAWPLHTGNTKILRRIRRVSLWPRIALGYHWNWRSGTSTPMHRLECTECALKYKYMNSTLPRVKWYREKSLTWKVLDFKPESEALKT